MFIKTKSNFRRAAFTLVEIMVAAGLSCVVVAAVITSFLMCTNSLMSISNYADLAKNSQSAIDQMSREIRGMYCLTNYTTLGYTNPGVSPLTTITNCVTFAPPGGVSSNLWVSYVYNPIALSLTRVQGTNSKVLLTDCKFLNFSMYQRNQTNGTFCPIPTTNPAITKLVQINWVCGKTTAMGKPSQTESVESAKVVLRSE